MVGHGVCPEQGFRILHLKIPKLELIPLRLKLVGLLAQTRVRRNVKVFIVNLHCGHVNLDITTGQEVEALPVGKLYHKLLDEGSHVVVRNYLTFPLFDAKDLFGHLNLHVVLDFYLAAQAPIVRNLLAIEESGFSR